MIRRSADVFFYGLFMDQELLRAKGLHPGQVELAWVEGLALRIGQRAALVSRPGARVYGLVVSLTLEELEKLYSEPSLLAYQPQAVLAHLSGGGSIGALCYNLADPPTFAEPNPAYVAELRAVAERAGLPAEYVASIQ
jgi:hypothetical protein